MDLNDGHLAACVLDASGNPIGEPASIEMVTAGLAASRRDGRVRAAITALLDRADQGGCAAIAIENLDFADARATGRETLGRGRRGKRLRRTIAGIPTRRFRDRLTSMAARRGIAVIGVDPAYTSKWGAQHWRKPLQQQTSDRSTVTGHHGASAAIGRRGLGLAIRRRPAAHTSGVSGWDQPVVVEDLYDWEKSTAALAAQAPWWAPGTASGYHALTYGHLVGEVLRRVTGMTLKQFVADEIAAPLGADFQIGAAPADSVRIAEIVPAAYANVELYTRRLTWVDTLSSAVRCMTSRPIFVPSADSGRGLSSYLEEA